MTVKHDPDTGVNEDAPLMSHLIELRTRMIRVVLVLLIAFVIIFSFFWEPIFKYILAPLVPENAKTPDGKFIATNPIAPFFTSISLSFSASLILLTPYLLIELWGFVAPGLYKHERKIAVPLLTSSVFLFYLGMLFAYFVVLPIFFGFIIGYTPQDVVYMPDMKSYLDFLLKIFFAFGIAFEVPIATMILCWSGVTTPDKLVEKRPYIIVGAFVVGMLLTPPDLFSQTFLAIPMWILFELGVIMARVYKPEKKAEDDEDDFDEEEYGDDYYAKKALEEQNLRLANQSKSSTAAGATNTILPPDSGEAEQSDETNEQERAETDLDSYDGDDDYRPMTDEELDAELDKFDEEMEALDKQYEEEQQSETEKGEQAKEEPEGEDNKADDEGKDKKPD